MSATNAGWETYPGYRFLRQRLIQDVTLASRIGDRVFPFPPDEDATYPFVVATFVPGTDLVVIGSVRVWANGLWQVEAWSKASDIAVIAELATRIDVALHKTRGTMTGATYGNGIIWAMNRERPLFLPPDRVGNRLYMRGGAEYRQLATAA